VLPSAKGSVTRLPRGGDLSSSSFFSGGVNDTGGGGELRRVCARVSKLFQRSVLLFLVARPRRLNGVRYVGDTGENIVGDAGNTVGEDGLAAGTT
jgi:hypothetical protein